MMSQRRRILFVKLKSSIIKSITAIAMVVLLLQPYNGDVIAVSEKDIIERIVINFCEGEFKGKEDVRLNAATWSKDRSLIENKKDPYFSGLLISWDHDPYILIESYRIGEIEKHDEYYLARVTYKRNLSMENKIYPNRSSNTDVSLLKIAKKNNTWKIIDPPTPRVSRIALIKHYENVLDRMSIIRKSARASKSQVEYYDKCNSILLRLKHGIVGDRVKARVSDRGARI